MSAGDKAKARHAALARLGERVWTPTELRALIADRKDRGWSLPREDRWARCEANEVPARG